MSKTQYRILNLVGGVCAVLVLVNLVFNRVNESSGQALNATQAQINRTQQVQTTAQNLVVRIAQAAPSEPALRDLMIRQDLKVNLGGENQTRTVNQDPERTLLAASRRNPFWVCLMVFLALAVDGGFRLARLLEQRRQFDQFRLTQAANIGRLSPVLAQAQPVKTKLQAISLDLIRIVRTNGLAAQLVREFNIQYTPGAETAALRATATNAAAK